MKVEKPKLTFSVDTVNGVQVLVFRCAVCGRAGTTNYIPGEPIERVGERIYVDTTVRLTCRVLAARYSCAIS
jgi:hypothetical protein